METTENQLEPNNSILEEELGTENLENVIMLNSAIKVEAQKQQIEVHLILVGGTIKPEKQGLVHKDVDLVLYSPQLATEYFLGGVCPKFDFFASFVCDVAKNLKWESKIEKPWFFDYDVCGDGKVILHTNGKPIEVLPVRQDRISNSFEDYLKFENDPYLVLF